MVTAREVSAERDGTALEVLIRGRLAAAVAALPGVTVPEHLARQLHATLAHSGDPVAALAALHLDDLVIAQACAGGDRRALAIFEQRHLARVPAILARHPARHDSDEITQRLRERLLVRRADRPARIADYTGKGSLAVWLRVAALRVASNLRRSLRPTDELCDGDALSHATPEVLVLESRLGASVRSALHDGFRALEPAERTVLRLHYLDGLTVDQLTPILATSRATAGRRLVAARARLAERTLGLLAERVQAPASELRSVLWMLVSRLEVSLRGLMGDP